MNKYYKITRKQDGVDFYLDASKEKTWERCTEMVETLLDSQYLKDGENWDEIGVTVQCVLLTDKEADELDWLNQA